jgi:lysophospholipase L1-like esterase
MQCSDRLAPSNRRRLVRSVLTLVSIIALGLPTAPVASAGRASAAQPANMWAASWAAAVHGPYPSGNAVAQPELKFAFPLPEMGADDQTFRLIVRPDLWSNQVRLRFANTFGTQPVAFDGVFVGLQASGGVLAAGTNRPVTFAGGTPGVTIPAGQSVYSDPVTLDYVDDPANVLFLGRKLAASFHVVGTSGPMTWHAKAMQTSYVTAPGAGAHGADESDAALSYSTTSWYFLDALDAMAPADTAVVAALGDSITDGTGSTVNGDDRWPDVLARRLHAAYGTRVSVVNEGIGGNQILGPATYSAQEPFSGGPAALQRLDRDVFGLSGLSGIVFLEGINDIGSANASADAVIGGIQELVNRVRGHGGLTIVGATLTSSLNSTNAPYGTPEANERRQTINAFIRGSGIFDSVADFDAVTLDPGTGELRAEFQPNSTTAMIDRLHPNRAGYLFMGAVVDIGVLAPHGAE